MGRRTGFAARFKDAPKGTMMGRYAFDPDGKERAFVEAMTAYGVPQAEMAAVIGISVAVLGDRFRQELDTAVPKANSKVAESLFQKAINGDTTAMIFWLKCRARWKEPRDDAAGDNHYNITINRGLVEYRDTQRVESKTVPGVAVERAPLGDTSSRRDLAPTSG